MSVTKYFICFALAFVGVSSEDLVNFIRPCSLSDVKINQCILDNGNNALNQLIQGDEKLNISSFLPYWHIKKLGGRINKNFKYILSNVKIFNFDAIKLVNASYSNSDNSITFKTRIPYAMLKANYDIVFDISRNHVEGNNSASALVDDITYMFKVYIKSGRNSNGAHYEVDRVDFEYTANKVTFDFQYLTINGKTDDEKTNIFINKYWTVFMSLVYPAWNEFFVDFSQDLFGKIFSAVPKEKIFLP